MLDRIEQIARIISRFIIPAVIAPVALIISSDIKKHDISMNYMELAMDVLRLPQDSDHNSELRKWALDIFTKYSPVPLDENLQKKIRGGEITLPPDLDKVSDIGSGRYVEVPLSSFISVVVASKQVTKQEIDRFVNNAHTFFSTKENYPTQEQYNQEEYNHRWKIKIKEGGAVQIFRTNNEKEFSAAWNGVSDVLEALKNKTDLTDITILVRGTERFYDIKGIGGVGGRTWIAFDLR